jgi:hypothetical protein
VKGGEPGPDAGDGVAKRARGLLELLEGLVIVAGCHVSHVAPACRSKAGA